MNARIIVAWMAVVLLAVGCASPTSDARLGTPAVGESNLAIATGGPKDDGKYRPTEADRRNVETIDAALGHLRAGRVEAAQASFRQFGMEIPLVYLRDSRVQEVLANDLVTHATTADTEKRIRWLKMAVQSHLKMAKKAMQRDDPVAYANLPDPPSWVDFPPLPADHPAGLVAFAERFLEARIAVDANSSNLPLDAGFRYNCLARVPLDRLTRDELLQVLYDKDELDRAAEFAARNDWESAESIIKPLWYRAQPLAYVLMNLRGLVDPDPEGVALNAEFIFRAANSGCFQAELYAAYLYRHGIGRYPDQKKAEYWAERAAASGFPFAADYLAELKKTEAR